MCRCCVPHLAWCPSIGVGGACCASSVPEPLFICKLTLVGGIHSLDSAPNPITAMRGWVTAVTTQVSIRSGDRTVATAWADAVVCDHKFTTRWRAWVPEFKRYVANRKSSSTRIGMHVVMWLKYAPRCPALTLPTTGNNTAFKSPPSPRRHHHTTNTHHSTLPIAPSILSTLDDDNTFRLDSDVPTAPPARGHWHLPTQSSSPCTKSLA